MTIGQEVGAFEEPVASKDGFEAGAWAPDGGVVTDAEAKMGGFGSGRKVQAGEPLNQQLLVWP
jgi:hypothetical protein